MRLLPRDERFFDLFTAVATLNVEAAKQLKELLATEMDRRLPIVESIKRLEHEADTITHEVVTRLDRSFITPLDREDIHTLASRLDDVMDLMDGCARRVQVFHADNAPKGAILLADTIVSATEQLQTGIRHLDKSRNGEVLQACVKVKALEEDGDAIYHQWLGDLFKGNPDPLLVIKWKEIYDTLEKTLDHAEDVANVLESIFIKHA
ncbi:MAG TPA: DUF47 family protein [Gemmatimonadales bacterium]|nr:DUF47 family protein [Gemmatimonadales bacterium]